MEELKKDKNYIEAKRNQTEGLAHTQTSCITCKFKPDYLAAIPCLRTAADMFFAFSKSKPNLYAQFLVSEEIKCREKLIVCLDKESSLIEAGDQGIKLSKLYIKHYKSYDLAYKTLENFNLSFIQTNSIGNNSVQRSLKGMSEIAKCFEEASVLDYANKAYSLLYDSAYSLFPGQVKENEPYDFIYNAFFDYFEFLLVSREFEKLNEEIIKTIEMVSPSLQEILQRERVQGKDWDIDNILSLYYKLLICKICLEDEKGFVEFFRKASEIKNDSAQDTILEAIEKTYDACMKGDEKLFNRNVSLLDSILRITEIKELRSKMRKFKKYEPENFNNDINLGKNYIENDFKNNKIKDLNNEIGKINNDFNKNLNQRTDYDNKDFNNNLKNNFNKESNLDNKIDMHNINMQMGDINKNMNENLHKLNELSDFGNDIFKKATDRSEDLINKYTEEKSHIQNDINERKKKYQIKNEDEEDENEKDFVINLDENKKNKENIGPTHDYL